MRQERGRLRQFGHCRRIRARERGGAQHVEAKAAIGRGRGHAVKIAIHQAAVEDASDKSGRNPVLRNQGIHVGAGRMPRTVHGGRQRRPRAPQKNFFARRIFLRRRQTEQVQPGPAQIRPGSADHEPIDAVGEDDAPPAGIRRSQTAESRPPRGGAGVDRDHVAEASVGVSGIERAAQACGQIGGKLVRRRPDRVQAPGDLVEKQILVRQRRQAVVDAIVEERDHVLKHPRPGDGDDRQLRPHALSQGSAKNANAGIATAIDVGKDKIEPPPPEQAGMVVAP